MDRRGYLALVLREATALVNEHESALTPRPGGRAALAKEGDGGRPDGDPPAGGDPSAVGELEKRLASALVEVDCIEDVLKHSGRRDIPSEYWREALTWTEALTSAAMAALVHDVRERARDILEGKIPRLDNIQAH